MCNGQANALSNTHGTITAAVLVQTSMPSIVLNPPTTTSGSTSRSNYSAGTSITASTTKPTNTSPSTLLTDTSKIVPPTMTTAPPSTTESAEAASETPTPAAALTKPQIIGITVGSIGGGAAALVGIILFACWRRRKQRKARDSDMLPFQLGPFTKSPRTPQGFRGSTERNLTGPGGTVNGVAAKVSPRFAPKVPPRLDISSPNMFSRRSIKPEMIGVAISPETHRSKEKIIRRSSKLLPEKPTLTVKVPQNLSKPPNLQPAANPSTEAGRESTATQFEEDFDSAVAAAPADDWSRRPTSGSQILQPSTGTWQSIRPVNNNPAPAALVVTGGDGSNWRPGQRTNSVTTAAPDYYIKALNINRGQGKMGSFSQPRRPDGFPVRPNQHQQQPPKLQLTVPNQAARPTTMASSIYSAYGSLPPSENARNSNSNMPRSQRSYKAAGPYDTHQSAGSLTSFETSDSVISPQDDTTHPDRESKRKTVASLGAADLSPVVESPASGKSPVSYPKIPARGRLPESTIRSVPPPKQPDFGAVLAAGNRNRMPNVGLDSGMKPWRAAEIQAQRERMGFGMGQGQIQSSQVQLPAQSQPQNQIQMQGRAQAEAQAQAQGQWRPRNQGPSGSLGRGAVHQRQPSREYIAPSAHFNFVPAPARSQTAPVPQQQTYRQPEQSYAPFLPQNQNQNRPGPNFSQQEYFQAPQQANPLNSHPSLTFTRTSSMQSQYSNFSQQSTSSSLLAKRRGEQKAEALKLKKDAELGKRGKDGKWRVLGKEEIERAKGEGWRPMLGSGKDMKAGNGEKERGDESGTSGDEGDLPGTPGWVPKLTPTRRGDELFLSVQ